MEIFAERIKELRLEHGLTQEAVGEIIGVKRYAVYSYEKGRACPEMKGLVALADYFEVSMDYLAGRTDKREINR
ncbi:MAG: helix-turn-helix transcriptional regulator [Oscillibacter sp.]|nr:helix-turn-helix transcriptional regulator [Oscillibacter sp.]